MTTTTTTTTSVIATACYRVSYDHATKTYTHHREEPTHIEIRIVTESPAKAGEIAALFPKSLRVKSWDSSKTATFCVNFGATNVNKGENEAGLARYRKFMARCAALGIEIVYAPPAAFTNTYSSLDEFNRALGI